MTDCHKVSVLLLTSPVHWSDADCDLHIRITEAAVIHGDSRSVEQMDEKTIKQITLIDQSWNFMDRTSINHVGLQ